MCTPKCLPEREEQKPGNIVIHAGRLIDGISEEPQMEVSITISDDRITAIDPGFIDAGDARLIDLSSSTVLPGLIDCHVHLSYDLAAHGPLLQQLVTRSTYDELLTAASNARRTLMAGFTSIRDVGGHTPVVVALKKSITAGETAGPRLWVSGDIICPTGGHADYRNPFDACLSKPHWKDGIADAEAECIKAVRERSRGGSDFIKIAPSGGVTSQGTSPHAQMMNDTEIAAIIDTAHAIEKKVAAHAHGKKAIDRCAALGVDSIEHGTFADDESYQLMKQSGTWLVPTLLVNAFQAEMAKVKPELLGPETARKVIEVFEIASKNVGAAYKNGVRIALGSDCGISLHGQNAKEFSLLVAAGMSPMHAIQSGTSSAAELIGASDHIGSIQVGWFADVIATKGDPLADISELERVSFVMKGGDVLLAQS